MSLSTASPPDASPRDDGALTPGRGLRARGTRARYLATGWLVCPWLAGRWPAARCLAVGRLALGCLTVGCLTLGLLAAPAQADLTSPAAAPAQWPAQAQAGDLVFRQGTEAVSAAVLSVDGGPYSHVGMLVGEPGQWQVIHATPAEREDRVDGVVIDALDFYLDPARAVQYALYQVDADTAQRAAAVSAAYTRLGDPFRIADPAGTYCTELVWAAWQSTGIDLAVTFTPLALPLLPGNYLLPRQLAASPRLHVLMATDTVPGTSTPAP